MAISAGSIAVRHGESGQGYLAELTEDGTPPLLPPLTRRITERMAQWPGIPGWPSGAGYLPGTGLPACRILAARGRRHRE